MNKKNIQNFIDYNYVPLTRSVCIKRILIFWIFNIPFYLLDKFSFFVGIIFSISNLFISAIFIKIAKSKTDNKESKFLCDGIACLYYSIISNIAAYIALSYYNGYNYFLFVALILSLIICIAVFGLLIFKFIKDGKYSNNSSVGKYAFVPFSGGLLGILLGRFFVSYNDNTQVGIIVIAMCLLIISYLMSIGSLNFVKLYFLKNQSKIQE